MPGPLCLAKESEASLGIEDTAQAYRQRAMESCEQHNPDLALELYEKAIEKAKKKYGPDSPYLADLYFEMGSVAKLYGKLPRAQRAFAKAVDCNPNSINARLELASVYRKQNNKPALYKEIQAARTKNPQSPQAQEAFVLYIQDLNRPAEAAREAAVIHHMVTAASIAAPAPTADNIQAAFIPSDQLKNPSSTKSSSQTKGPSTTAAIGPLVTPATTQSKEKTGVRQEANNTQPSILKKLLPETYRKEEEQEAVKKLENEKISELERERAQLNLEKERIEQERQALELSKKRAGEKRKISATKHGKSKTASRSKAAAWPDIPVMPLLKTTATLPTEPIAADEHGRQSNKTSRSSAFSSGVGATKGVPESEKNSDQVSENEPRIKASEDLRKAPPAQALIRTTPSPAAQSATYQKGKSRHASLVPPPPPSTPMYPNFLPPVMAPGQYPTQSIMQQTQQAKPKARSKETAKEIQTQPEESSPPSSSGGNRDESDFLIDWGGGGAKQKKKHK